MPEFLHTATIFIHVLVCVLLMLVVLIQPGKSGGLGAALGGAGAQQLFGGRGAGNFLTKMTWISASVFFLTSITLAYISTSTGDSLEDLAAKAAAEITPAQSAEDSSAAKEAESAAEPSEAPAGTDEPQGD